jgi:hypothetical protein
LRITCIERNWTISTYEQSLLGRLREVASLVFEALGHTPVSAYGLNFTFHRKTGVTNIGSRLAQIVDTTPLTFLKEAQGEHSAKITYTISGGNRDLNISVEPSVRGSDTVFIAINAHHPIVLLRPGFHQFDLTPLLRESMDRDFRDAQEILLSVTRTFEVDGK